MEYFISEGSKTVGPFTKEQLKEKRIIGNTLVYTDETNWVEAKTIEELADIIRRIPPPPPPMQQAPPKLATSPPVEPVFYAPPPPKIAEKPKSRTWLYGVIVALGISGGGFVWQQNVKTQQFMDEIQAKEMVKQEEEAKAEREIERKRKRQEINAQKNTLRNQVLNLESELSVQRDKLERVKEWQFGRSSSTREKKIRIVTTNIINVENALQEANVRLAELENKSKYLNNLQ